MAKKQFKRGLAPEYLKQLKTNGPLSFLRNKKWIKEDIDIQIRNNYINLYYKGASLLKFTWEYINKYKIEINCEYFKPIEPTCLPDYSTTKDKKDKDTYRAYKFDQDSIKQIKPSFNKIIKQIKKNIDYLGKGKENAFEQLFIESNLNKKNNPGFIVVDRQVIVEGRSRLDLVAISKIGSSDEYRLNLIELKYGEDRRIPEVFDQIDRYYKDFQGDYPNIVKVYSSVIKQKIQIGKWPYPKLSFRISSDPSTMRKIVVLGNIREDHRFIHEAIKRANKNNAFLVIQNNILEESKLMDINKCNS